MQSDTDEELKKIVALGGHQRHFHRLIFSRFQDYIGKLMGDILAIQEYKVKIKHFGGFVDQDGKIKKNLKGLEDKDGKMRKNLEDLEDKDNKENDFEDKDGKFLKMSGEETGVKNETSLTREEISGNLTNSHGLENEDSSQIYDDTPISPLEFVEDNGNNSSLTMQNEEFYFVEFDSNLVNNFRCRMGTHYMQLFRITDFRRALQLVDYKKYRYQVVRLDEGHSEETKTTEVVSKKVEETEASSVLFPETLVEEIKDGIVTNYKKEIQILILKKLPFVIYENFCSLTKFACSTIYYKLKEIILRY